MKVYVVTDGEYSDYHIEAVFTDREQALIYCATHGFEFEEYEADQVKLETTKTVKERWNARFGFEGDFCKAWKEGYEFDTTAHINFRVYGRFYYVSASLPVDTDGEKAKKILCDMFAKFKQEAYEEGLQPWEKVRRLSEF